MSKIQISKSVTFALEMVRACLPLIPQKGIELGNMFMQMNMESQGSEREPKHVVLNILIYPDISVSALATVVGGNGELNRGRVAIQLPLNNTVRRGEPIWHFECRFNAETGKMEATLLSLCPHCDWIRSPDHVC